MKLIAKEQFFLPFVALQSHSFSTNIMINLKMKAYGLCIMAVFNGALWNIMGYDSPKRNGLKVKLSPKASQSLLYTISIMHIDTPPQYSPPGGIHKYCYALLKYTRRCLLSEYEEAVTDVVIPIIFQTKKILAESRDIVKKTICIARCDVWFKTSELKLQHLESTSKWRVKCSEA